MPDTPSSDLVSVDVISACARAIYAVRNQDIDGMAAALGYAVAAYEQHPSYAHEPLNYLRDVVLWIRAGRRLCASLERSDFDFAALEARAEALRRPLH